MRVGLLLDCLQGSTSASLSQDTEGCKLSTYHSLEHFRCFRVFEFLQIKSDARNLREALECQLHLEGCKHEVMIAANVGTWERSCVCFVDAGFEALGCPDEVYLVVTLPVPGCDPARQRHARLLSQTNNGIGKCWQG